MSEHMSPIPSRLYNAAVGGHVAGADQIVDDETGLTLDKVTGGALEEKEYTSGSDNGMGRVVLRKNLVEGVNTLTQAMINKSNTIYVIQYDFTLGGNITIPANCVLEFDGGSINGDGISKDTITGTNTSINAPDVAIFKTGISISGTWNCKRIVSTWFGDASSNNRINQLLNLASDTLQNEVIIENGNYEVSVDRDYGYAIFLKSNTKLIINGIITLLPNSFDGYEIVQIQGKENVEVCGSGKIIGDKYTRVDTTTYGEHGFGINILVSNNIHINDLEICNCFGDSINITGYDGTNSKSVTINNCHLHNSNRQGISVTGCDNFKISNCYIHDISGTAPESGIDIEPNANLSCTYGIIENNKIDNPWSICSYEPGFVRISNIIIRNNNCSGMVELVAKDSIVSNNFIGNVARTKIIVKEITNNTFGAIIDESYLSPTILCAEFILNNTFDYTIGTDPQTGNPYVLPRLFTLGSGTTVSWYKRIIIEDNYSLTPVTAHYINVNDYMQAILQANNNIFTPDKPFKSGGAALIKTIGNLVSIINKGTVRPTLDSSYSGFQFFDESLNPQRPIWYKGNNEWVDATGTPV